MHLALTWHWHSPKDNSMTTLRANRHCFVHRPWSEGALNGNQLLFFYTVSLAYFNVYFVIRLICDLQIFTKSIYLSLSSCHWDFAESFCLWICIYSTWFYSEGSTNVQNWPSKNMQCYSLPALLSSLVLLCWAMCVWCNVMLLCGLNTCNRCSRSGKVWDRSSTSFTSIVIEDIFSYNWIFRRSSNKIWDRGY